VPSRSMARRVARLEAAPGGTRGPCRECRGFGRVSLVDGRKGQTAADARGCPSCGAVSKIILLEAGGG
jgi:hypothetical protein